MRVQYCRKVFGVELRTDEPTPVGNLDYLHQLCRRVDAHTLHTGILVILLILIVKLIPVSMPFLYDRCIAVCFLYTTASNQFTVVGTESHCSPHLVTFFCSSIKSMTGCVVSADISLLLAS